MALTAPPANAAAPGTAPSRADVSTFRARADAAWTWMFGTFYVWAAAFRTWYGDTAKPELEALQTDVAAKQAAAAASATAAQIAADSVLSTSTYAALPSAAANTSKRIRVTDIGIAPGMVLVSDGTRWVPDGVQVLARSAVAVSAGANTSVNALASITIPAGLMGVNGRVRVHMYGSHNNSGNNVTWSATFGGTSLFSLSGNSLTFLAESTIANTGSATAQAATSFYEAAATPAITSAAPAINSAAAVTLALNAQKAVSGDTATLVSYLVEILP